MVDYGLKFVALPGAVFSLLFLLLKLRREMPFVRITRHSNWKRPDCFAQTAPMGLGTCIPMRRDCCIGFSLSRATCPFPRWSCCFGFPIRTNTLIG